MACSKHQRFVSTCPYCRDDANAAIAEGLERRRDALLGALRELTTAVAPIVEGKRDGATMGNISTAYDDARKAIKKAN